MCDFTPLAPTPTSLLRGGVQLLAGDVPHFATSLLGRVCIHLPNRLLERHVLPGTLDDMHQLTPTRQLSSIDLRLTSQRSNQFRLTVL